MSASIICIRPQPGLAATISAGRSMGLEIVGEPLFAIRSVPWTAPDPATVDALLIGSANVFRHGGPQLERLRGIPVHAVGSTTAELAAEAGFAVERIGSGGLQSLMQAEGSTSDSGRRYLRLSGAERVALDVPAGSVIEERIVYEAVPLAISPGFERRLRAGGIVLLHSAAAARHFAGECNRLCIPREALSLAALGPRITDGLAAGWRAVRHANVPTDAALLALAGDMCQDR
ncbi:uroporphyrinogen-III synthase [Allopontixanthobacter sp.]|uniref:uroporphyrinogen-III synthase n=1 Tax=Allopontixanthobacter sp. TaxID=2906452 RepID=UPI002AB8B5FB|nr:uroporphyrinogen-III synthase [Allopontixanthobacter sp.]MDZ4307074.1 uroporphyrinogen-III synthase [Allopontixanthobacter sp.]